MTIMMRARSGIFNNFGRNQQTASACYRPDREKQLGLIFSENKDTSLLARGAGLSYNDCCLNHDQSIIDTSRLNHLLAFDAQNGILEVQPAVNFADIFTVNANYIPAVIPGTLAATMAGAIANDIHGKNNVHEGSFGDHLLWLQLQCGQETVLCSPEQNRELFFATIGGLGLTGIIRRLAVKLKFNTPFVRVESEKFNRWDSLFAAMLSKASAVDYQAAWLDLLNKPAAVLSWAMAATHNSDWQVPRSLTVPPLPFRCITPWGMRLFNRAYYQRHDCGRKTIPLVHYNNPLDQIRHWNRLYGKQGLLQFQAVFPTAIAVEVLEKIINTINKNNATPTLTVLKYLSRPGRGLLSFPAPGFTLAIDFINNIPAQTTIMALNNLITQVGGKVYLAKDRLLTPEQFRAQYPQHDHFRDILQQLALPISSNLSRRLGITS